MTLEAFIFYSVLDQAFERAARTVAGVEEQNSNRLFIEVKTKEDFFEAWQKIAQEAATANQEVSRVCVFSHASKQVDGQDGLEFAALEGASGTIKRDDISSLTLLPWQDSLQVRLELFGCNTGLRGGRGWCPAEHFAQVQLVPCRGESGFSYFSKELEHYEPQTPEDSIVFLHAYRRGINDPLGDGSKMPTRAYDPFVRKSVGVNSANENADVLAVQQLLNELPADQGRPNPPLEEDGLIGPKTINAIKAFQQIHFGFQDGVVEPGKKTIVKLIEFRQSD